MAEKWDISTLNNIARRAQYLAMQMIHIANNRDNVEKGDPKIGGHASASSSALHILGALYLYSKSGYDFMANKPHTSPTDHAYNYLLNLFYQSDLSKMSLEDCNTAMHGLRAFSQNGEPVFQSYHSIYDPDHQNNYFPSGTVGIPPVQAGYMALAYRYAARHGYEVPPAHFWALIGDSEFREGSLFEATPDFAERELGNLTWIVDYNRQSLDGHRITNKEIMGGSDDYRIERTMAANGWEVIQVRHGKFREELFKMTGGEAFKQLLEGQLDDYELQVLLNLKDGASIRQELSSHKELGVFLKAVKDDDLHRGIRDLGGHDIRALIEAFEQSKKSKNRPTMVIAHTIKGWGLEMAAAQANHSALPEESEIIQLGKNSGMSDGELFARFDENSAEGKFLKKRGEQLYSEVKKQNELKEKNKKHFLSIGETLGEIPATLDINFKMANYPHTQWMLGQLTAKLTRIANTSLDEKDLKDKQKPLNDLERRFKLASEMMVSMAPDVGTSTNLNPAMDGKIFGQVDVEDLEAEFGVKDTKSPDLVPGQDVSDRFLRFDIVEANVMSCMGSFGRIRDTLGIPLLPLMTVYDFFVKRAHDQFFYDLYWKSSFIAVGTPSGVTLSPEGAQHGWKSDFQIPNQITWEPFYCQELDWIFVESLRRHVTFDNEGRTGVFIRGVTRGADQKEFLGLLRTQRRFKASLEEDQLLHPGGFAMDGAIDESSVVAMPDEEILSAVREDVLQGGYYLIDYRGYAGYDPADNVVHIFAMGSLGTEAIKASRALLEKGIYANVVMVPNTDLLIGNLGHENNYHHLKNNLGINGDLYLRPQEQSEGVASDVVSTLAGRRIPIVSVHDGEIGLLDNIGSIVGVKQECLAVRKHSKCGRPSDVYRYHHIDADSVVEAVMQVLEETAIEQVHIKR